MGALARNAKSQDGARDLFGALERDHDGGLLEMIGGFVERGNTEEGDSILEHVFGKRRERVETTVGRSTGLDSQTISKLLALLAPIVMAQLGQARKQKQLDPGGLAELLEVERARLEQTEEPAAPPPKPQRSLIDMFRGSKPKPASVPSSPTASTSPLGELARQVLDSDGDGDFSDDAIRIGGGILADLLRGKQG